MKSRVHNSPNLIYSVGTQVVALKQVQGSNGEAVHPSGAVGVVVRSLSPLVVHTTSEHEELKAIAKDCITRHHAHHYVGFAATQWKLFRKEVPPKVKPLLYVYRVLLTGIHLMRTGDVQANLLTLNESVQLPYIDELVERKLAGPEKGRLDEADVDFHEREYGRLVRELEIAMEESTLPEQASCKAALNDLLIRTRLGCLSIDLKRTLER